MRLGVALVNFLRWLEKIRSLVTHTHTHTHTHTVLRWSSPPETVYPEELESP